MDTTEYGTPLSKALLTGLFAGLGATLVCLVFGVAYRSLTGFEVFDEFLNFPTFIFGTNSLLSAIGILYFYFLKLFKHGTAVYVAGIVMAGLLCLAGVQLLKRQDITAQYDRYKEMASAVIIILTVAALMIPVLYHNKKFLKFFI